MFEYLTSPSHGLAEQMPGEQLQSGLNLLCDLDYVACRTLQTGGRPRTVYTVNPMVLSQ